MIIETIQTEWKQIKLKDIGNAIIGLTYKPSDVVKTGGKLVFRSSNIQNHKIDYSDQIRVLTQIPDNLMTREGDILICARNGSRKLIGKSAYITSKDANNTFGAFMSIFRTKNSRYIFYLFQSHLFQKEINKDLGPTINQVTTGNLLSFKFYLPPISEQKRIVAVLETWDRAIEKLEKKIELKKNVKKGLMKQLLNGDKRLGGYQSKWKAVKLGDIAVIRRGGSPRPIESFITTETDGYNWLRIGDINSNDKYINSTTEKIRKEGLKKTTFVRKGDFILSNSMSFGRPYIVNIDTCIHDGWLALMELSPKINKEYLYYLLSSYKVQCAFSSLAAGSGVRNLKKEIVSLVQVDVPEIAEQNAIANILIGADSAIQKLEKKLSILEDQKKYLLNKLVTGEIRTPEDLTIFSNTDEKET